MDPSTWSLVVHPFGSGRLGRRANGTCNDPIQPRDSNLTEALGIAGHLVPSEHRGRASPSGLGHLTDADHEAALGADEEHNFVKRCSAGCIAPTSIARKRQIPIEI